MPSRRVVDPEGVHASRQALPKERMILGLCDIFKMLGDATRLKILMALSRSELCVGDLASLLSLTESAVSHQLRLMKSMRLVRHRREGKMMYYVLDDEHVEDLIRVGVRHVGEV
jgi:ArsR family transcriptional regulator, lead/cadmium/zinc/bismuth-responsive transcriptional repressor